MPDLDLIIRGATVVRDSLEKLDIGISDGKIVRLEPEILSASESEIDARGLHVMAGMIDVHVHFNEPGRTDWEGIATGSAALAAGGGTLFFDMPLNSSPVTTNAKSFKQKLTAMERSSVTDFALWGGLVPGNLQELPELAACGVIGFKAFMSNSGLEEFGASDDLTLLEGMRVAASLGLPVAVHAESDAITGSLSSRAKGLGKTGIRDYLESRPVIAELEAISRAILFAEETGCALHLVHVSSGRGVVLAVQARARGANVTIETCPHYLAFTEEDLERLGAVAKCAPPLRSKLEQDLLWQQILQGQVDMIGSDHSPAPPSMKTSSDFFAIWGGISGVQSSLNVLLTQGFQARGLSLNDISSLISTNPAQRFKLAHKGKLELGFDADLVMLDLNASFVLTPEMLEYRHQQSPYLGQEFKGAVKRTLSRGQTVFLDDENAVWDRQTSPNSPQGRLVKPAGYENQVRTIGTDSKPNNAK
jgi:allantoinase